MARRGTRGSSNRAPRPRPAAAAPALPPPAQIEATAPASELPLAAPADAAPPPKRPPRQRAPRKKAKPVDPALDGAAPSQPTEASAVAAAVLALGAAPQAADEPVTDAVDVGPTTAHLAKTVRQEVRIHHGPEARATQHQARATQHGAGAAQDESRVAWDKVLATRGETRAAWEGIRDTGDPRSVPRAKWSRRRTLSIAAAAAAGVALFTLLLAWHTPRWYQPMAPPPERRQAIRDDVQDIANRFSEQLLQTQPFLVEFTDAQLNEWFATREYVWPRLRDILPPDVEEPCVRFRPDRIELAACLPRITGRPVVTARIELAVEGDEIVLRVTGARIGALPAPLDWLRGGLASTQLDHRDERSGLRVSGSLARGVRAPARLTWWNGRRDFIVRRVELDRGVIRFLIEPGGSRRVTDSAARR